MTKLMGRDQLIPPDHLLDRRVCPARARLQCRSESVEQATRGLGRASDLARVTGRSRPTFAFEPFAPLLLCVQHVGLRAAHDGPRDVAIHVESQLPLCASIASNRRRAIAATTGPIRSRSASARSATLAEFVALLRRVDVTLLACLPVTTTATSSSATFGRMSGATPRRRRPPS
jgi:hypothetical protein